MKKYLYPANILLPKENFEKWAVIACDQYTSDRDYWQSVEETVGSSPSALNIILPEIYLDETEQRVEKINATMGDYLSGGVLDCLNNSFVYVEREITGGAIRRGIVGMLDLEDYDYNKGSSALCRATEQTVAERIPPRVAIRKNAPLELPHVMVFINDPENRVLGPLCDKNSKNCSFLRAYTHQLSLLDINDIMSRTKRVCAEAQKTLGFEEEPIAVFIVHEAPDNPCSERAAIQEYFRSHGIECEEWE